MFVTERKNENISISGVRSVQGIRTCIDSEAKGFEGCNRPDSDRGGGEMDDKENLVVRRITPLECERLQGFPDGWTDIGEWTDTKGKIHKESSDSARYKALGNSIATPFWFYLLRRIAAQYERPATLGSLFDGIGGFPYCWERCNGEGTAIWASEIEEFPIAVTKKHFGEE
jgi:site-specific DNA-cytosine methylase